MRLLKQLAAVIAVALIGGQGVAAVQGNVWLTLALGGATAVLAVFTGRGLAWWALIAPVAMVKLQPGLRLKDLRFTGLPALRARTAREASATEARRSPLNALVVVVLLLVAIALR